MKKTNKKLHASGKELLEDLIKTRNAIKKKFRAAKTGRVETEAHLEETFKPITKPLQELLTNVKHEPKIKAEYVDEDYDNLKFTPKIESTSVPQTSTPLKPPNYSLMSEDEFATPTHSRTLIKKEDSTLNVSSGLVEKYFDLYIKESPKIDYTYGVYLDKDEWKIGNSKIVVEEDNFLIKGNSYKITLGLCELLFMKEPVKSLYSKEDLANYQAILKDTNAYKREYSDDGQIKGSKAFKYKDIISKLIYHEGRGLMHIPKNNIDYVYWNESNELVDRLRLLIASQNAGHNNHNNEIMSIFEELREANIIV